MSPFADTPDDFVRPTRYPLSEALDIYRNNWRHNLRQALAGAYPVLVQVVGEAFFRQLATRFMDEHPSASGNLHDYGDALPAFLQGFAPAQPLSYLPDLAALEWACHRAYFAPDEPPLDLQALARLPEQVAEGGAGVVEDTLEHLRFEFHPACTLLASPWPVDAIWRAHQPGAPEDFRIDLKDGPCRVLVNRSEGEATVSALAEDEFRWLREIHAGATLGDATARTLEHHPDFNPGILLPRLALGGTWTRFTLENRS
ncbi:MAG: putative DNA-binding domain-containing protein [Betaproteobacteria bacterium]|nr:putative DNA-binding domain-containing protein [Betaproteobacteria bacterium]